MNETKKTSKVAIPPFSSHDFLGGLRSQFANDLVHQRLWGGVNEDHNGSDEDQDDEEADNVPLVVLPDNVLQSLPG